MKYVKTVNPITADGRKRSLSVGYAIKDLGLNVGDKLLAYLARPEDEFEIDTLLNGAGKQYYIVFSDRTDIIAAGNNTRIAEHLHYSSKVLIPIGGKAEADIRTEVEQSSYSNRVMYVRQEVASGTLDAVRLAMSCVNDDVFLVLGDEFLINDRIDKMVDDFNNRDLDVIVGIIPNSDDCFVKDAYTLHYESGFVDKFVEKPKTIFNNDRGTGYYIIGKDVLKYLSDIDSKKKDIIDLFNYAIENGTRTASFQIAEEEYNINTIQQLDRAVNAFNSIID